MKDALTLLGAVTVMLLFAALVILGPLVTIWALNTLFPALDIPINLATWFAVFWMELIPLGKLGRILRKTKETKEEKDES